MTAPKIRTMSPGEDTAFDTIVLAFTSDPAARWTWPDPGQYLAAMPRLARAFGGKAFTSGSAYCTEDYSGVALWLPPGTEPDDEALKIMQSTLTPSRLDNVTAVFGQMEKYHPKEPHWFLPLIAVDPLHQGKGLGGALMAHALERCDRDGAPAYLESSNPRNIPLYQRHGFEPIGKIQSGSSPTIVPMLRKAR